MNLDCANMKAVIMAGGFGTRISEETDVRPKPMVEIGCRPILWHILKHFSHHGVREFIIALGYKGDVIKQYWMDYFAMHGSITVLTSNGSVQHHHDNDLPDWTIHLVETGIKTGTGGRVNAVRHLLDPGPFFVTHGDSVSDLDLPRLAAFHRNHGKAATITAVRPPARFGHLKFDGDRISEFSEKPQTAEGWINGGISVFDERIHDYIETEETMLERAPMERLAADNQLMAYRHESFWQCMDNLRDKRRLEALWESGDPPWRTWENQHEDAGHWTSGVHRDNLDAAA